MKLLKKIQKIYFMKIQLSLITLWTISENSVTKC